MFYSNASVFQTFLVTTAIAFGGLSLVGYTTKRDLTAMGSFMIMGLVGPDRGDGGELLLPLGGA